MNPGRRFDVRFLALLLAACLLVAGCATSTPTPTPTPAQVPMVQCTPPYCWEDEVPFCEGQCPGGCGTTCATITPAPNASPTPTFPPLSDVCVLPTPDPTQAEPHMDLCASASQIRVGGVIQLAIRLSGVARSAFVSISGQDVDSYKSFFTRARTGDHLPALINAGAHLKLDYMQTHGDEMFFVLQGVSSGEVKVDVRAGPTYQNINSSLTLTVLP